MSLINKLLTDLEERHNLLQGKDEAILDGLTSVTARRSEQRINIPINFIIVSFFLAASLVFAYGVMRDGAKEIIPAVVHIPESAQSDIRPEVESTRKAVGSNSEILGGVEDQTVFNPPEPSLEPPVNESPAPLIAPVLSPEIHAGTPLVINDMAFVEEERTITLSLRLNGKTHYNAYTLTKPDRVVLEIDDAKFSADVPGVDHITQIKGIRIGDRPGEALKVVIDTNQPLSIEKAWLVGDMGAFVLNMILYPTLNVSEAVEYVQAPEPALQEAVPPAKEENFGQMNVRRSGNADTISYSDRLYKEAVMLYRKKDTQKANGILFDALARDPLHVNGRLLLASKLLEQKDINSAEKLLRTGLGIKADVPEWAKLYAHILTLRNRNAEAVTALMAALPAVTKDAEYYALLAALLQQGSRHEEAVELYKKTVNLDSTNGVWWMGLAISLDALDRADEALYAYGESLKGKGMTHDLHQYVHEQITRLTARKNS